MAGLLAVLLACGGAAEVPVAGPVSDPALRPCETPRPEVCTRELRPVCALRDTGIRCITTPCDAAEWVTRPNACEACREPATIGHWPGVCPEEHAPGP